MTFETQRLFLRPTDEEDAAFLLELMNTPKWIQFIGDRKVHSLEAAIHYVRERMKPQYDRLGYGNFTVIRKSDQVKIGTCGLYDRKGLEGIDLGFAFLPAYHKQGYAFEAAQQVMEAGLNQFGIQHLQAITVKENIASQRLLEKLGLRFQRIIRLPDDPEDLMLYLFHPQS
jgi:ribosomal-protein-alanine N-acetyltransferase